VARAAVIPVVECPVHDERGKRVSRSPRANTLATAGPQSVDTLRSLAIRVGCRTRELMAHWSSRANRDRPVRSATRRLIEDSLADLDAPQRAHAR